MGDQDYRTESDAGGHFRLPLPPGPARVSVFASEHHTFVQQETLAARQELAVTYLIERERYNLNETVVVAERRRDEVSRITLRGDEIQKIPGTFGDPFRVIQTLPGVSSVVSLLPFPIVRGASPASTGFLLDGTRIPLLFHLLAGPSVVHPVFIDEIQFFPGGAPAPYGGYVGGIVDGRTRRARPDERLLDFDVNLLQAGGFVRAPVAPLGATVTAAGRYGYPGFLLGLATNEVSLSYWDYQLRLDGGTPANSWTVFLFGARDQLDTPAPNAMPNDPNPPLEPSLILGFHRLDLRLNLTQGRLAEMFRAVLGYDRTLSNGTDFWVWTAEPQIAATWTQSSKLRIAGGVLGTFRSLRQGATALPTDNPFAAITSSLGTIYVGSSYLETIWRPTPDVLIRPGVRADVYADATATKPAVDPRLTLRYRLFERNLPDSEPTGDARAVWLKASAGIYHQPPRFVLPLPGLDLMPLKYGLLRSYQTSVGAEIPLREKTSLSVEGFFNYMDPTIFDLSFNQASVVTDPNRTILPTNIVMPHDRGAGDHRSPHRAADRSRVRSRGAPAPAVEDRPLRLDLVHALALRAVPRRRLGALRLRSPASLQPRRGAAAAPQLGSRPAPAVPERPPHHDDRRLQRRVRRGLLSFRLSRRQARRLAQLAARLLRRRHQRRAPPRGGPARRRPPLRPAHRRRPRPVLAPVPSPRSGPLAPWERVRVRGPARYSASAAVANDSELRAARRHRRAARDAPQLPAHRPGQRAARGDRRQRPLLLHLDVAAVREQLDLRLAGRGVGRLECQDTTRGRAAAPA